MAVPERIAVIGGGVSGLAAAIHLAERGLDVTVLEKTDVLGGKSKAWEVRLPDQLGRDVGPLTVEHSVHGWWTNYRNFRAWLNRAGDGGPSLDRGVAGMSAHDLMVIDAGRFQDRRGRSTGRPGLRAYDNYVHVDESMMGEMWGLLDTRNLNPWLLPVVTRLARVSMFLFGVADGTAIAWISYLLKDPASLLRLARRERGVRVLCAFLSHQPPLWLDDWTLEQAFEVAPIHERVREYMTLVQSVMNYDDPALTSAYHMARCFDFFGMRDAATMWWQSPQVGAHYDVVGRMAAHAASVGVRVLPMTYVVPPLRPAGKKIPLACNRPLDNSEFDYVVVATDSPTAASMLSRLGAGLSTRISLLGSSHVMILRVFFKKRINLDPALPSWAGVIGAREVGCPFDFIFVTSRFQRGNAKAPGEVLEFHLPMADRFNQDKREAILEQVLDWAFRFYPELRVGSARDSVHYLTFNDIRNYTRNNIGSAGEGVPGVEPVTDTNKPESRIVLCGDWIRYPSPVQYMEKAFVTGVEAANAILRRTTRPTHAILPLPEPSAIQQTCDWITTEIDRERPGPTPPSRRGP